MYCSYCKCKAKIDLFKWKNLLSLTTWYIWNYLIQRYEHFLWYLQVILKMLVSKESYRFWKKRGKTGPTMQLFAGFTDDKPVVIGLSNLFVNINRPGWFISIYKPCKSFQWLNPACLKKIGILFLPCDVVIVIALPLHLVFFSKRYT